MRRATKLTILANVAFVALAGAVSTWVFFGVRVPRREEWVLQLESQRLVPEGFPPVERVRIEHRGSAPTVLEKQNGAWRLTEPVMTLADEAEVAAFLLVVRALSSQTEVLPADQASTEELAPFGLDEPFVALTLEAEGATHRVFFGATSNFDGRLFSRAERGPVLLIDGNTRYTLDRRARDFREKRVMRFHDSMVAHVDVELPDQRYRLERLGAIDWRIIAEVEDRADAAEVQRLLALIRGIRAIGFPETGSTEGLDFDRPFAKVTVGLNDGSRPIELVVADRLEGEQRRYLARGTDLAELVELPGGSIRDLQRSGAELRYRNLLHFELEGVNRVEILFRGERYLVERSEGRPSGWLWVSPVEREAEGWRISSILSTLLALKAEDIVIERVDDAGRELAPLGLAPAEIDVRLLGEDGELLDALKVGARRADRTGHRHATNAEQSRVFTIHEARLGTLLRSLDDVLAPPAEP